MRGGQQAHLAGVNTPSADDQAKVTVTLDAAWGLSQLDLRVRPSQAPIWASGQTIGQAVGRVQVGPLEGTNLWAMKIYPFIGRGTQAHSVRWEGRSAEIIGPELHRLSPTLSRANRLGDRSAFNRVVQVQDAVALDHLVGIVEEHGARVAAPLRPEPWGRRPSRPLRRVLRCCPPRSPAVTQTRPSPASFLASAMPASTESAVGTVRRGGRQPTAAAMPVGVTTTSLFPAALGKSGRNDVDVRDPPRTAGRQTVGGDEFAVSRR